MKKKVYLLIAAMILLFGDLVVQISDLSIGLLPGFLGFYFMMVLSAEYMHDSVLARALGPVCLISAAYSLVLYIVTVFDYSMIAEAFWGNALALVETCLKLIVCYLLILTLQNVSIYRKIYVDLQVSMIWFFLLALASVGIYFGSGVMSIASGIIQRVVAVILLWLLVKVVKGLEIKA